MEHSYSHLLQNPKWNIKRLEVFENDNYECQKCSNANIVSLSKSDVRSIIKKGIILSIIKKHNVLAMFNSGDLRMYKFTYGVKFKGDGENQIFNSEILCNIDLDDNEISKFPDCEIYYFNFKAFLIGTKSLQDRVVFRIVNKQLTAQKKLFYIKKLHAHHTFYQLGAKPWKYDKGIITLCEFCHEEFHRNNQVPIKNRDGETVDFLHKGSDFDT